MSSAQTFATRIDLPAPVREKMIALLNQQLADTFDLFSQIKQAHWNVKGPQFIALHELFDKLAEDVEESVDTIAERATALGGTALGTARMAAGARGCRSTRPTPSPAPRRSPRWPSDSPHWPDPRAPGSTWPRTPAMPTPRMCSRRSPAASTRTSGSSKPTSRLDREPPDSRNLHRWRANLPAQREGEERSSMSLTKSRCCDELAPA